MSEAQTRPLDRDTLLATIDGMRAAVESGQVIAIVAAGVTGDDRSITFAHAAGTVHRARVFRAIAELAREYAATGAT